VLGFGLRLAARLIRVLHLGFALDTGPEGTTIAVHAPQCVDACEPQLASNA
jgi:hypothetical protein